MSATVSERARLKRDRLANEAAAGSEEAKLTLMFQRQGDDLKWDYRGRDVARALVSAGKLLGAVDVADAGAAGDAA